MVKHNSVFEKPWRGSRGKKFMESTLQPVRRQKARAIFIIAKIPHKSRGEREKNEISDKKFVFVLSTDGDA